MPILRPLLACAVALAATSALAQSNQVSVELTKVADALAQRLGYDEARLPMSVLVPPAVAAEACGIPVEMLSPQGSKRGDGCIAAKPTAGLDRVVRAQIRSDEALGGPPGKATHGKTGPATRQ